MSVGLSITSSQETQVSNFVCSHVVGTIDADVTSGESRWSGPLLKQEKDKKNFKRIKFISITGARSISCPDLEKYSVGCECSIWWE